MPREDRDFRLPRIGGPTRRQYAPLFGVSRSPADRIIDHLGPTLALQQRKRSRKDMVLAVDGTLVPTRDHSISEPSQNSRYSTNHQVITRLVVTVGWPLPGNRSGCKTFEPSGAKDAVGRHHGGRRRRLPGHRPGHPAPL